MIFTPANSGSLFVFLVINISIVSAFLMAVYVSTEKLNLEFKKLTLKTALGILVFLVLFCIYIASGFIGTAPMPRLPMTFLVLVILAVGLAFSRVGTWIARGVALQWLVLFQVFRLPLEFVLHSWGEQKTIPMSMTYNGQNLDIITGVVVLLLFKSVKHYKAAAWIANAIGFVLLLNVVRVAILSSPLPFAWPVEVPLQVMLYLPYALIGPICVGGALVGHLILTRALLMKQNFPAN